LRSARRELGYSIRVLAEILGIDAIRLKAWECGDEPIPVAEDLETAFIALRRTRRAEWPVIGPDPRYLRLL
jgi:transcriptional regulator with XRE-family HTH domain